MRTAWAVGASLVMSVAVQPAIASNLPFNNTAEAALSEDIVVPDESKMYPHGPRFLTAPGAITAVWANTGEDKVAQEELRTRKGNRSHSQSRLGRESGSSVWSEKRSCRFQSRP